MKIAPKPLAGFAVFSKTLRVKARHRFSEIIEFAVLYKIKQTKRPRERQKMAFLGVYSVYILYEVFV